MKSISVPVSRHRNGFQVVPDHPEQVREFVQSRPEGWRGIMTIADEKKPRTRGQLAEEGNQDGAFFGPIMKVLMDEIWFTKNKDEAYIRTLEEVSFVMVRNPKGGHPVKKLIHVSDMDREQMARFIDDVLMWAAQEHGVYIPNPDPKKSKRWAATFKARGYSGV